jgi:hypothetical protein
VDIIRIKTKACPRRPVRGESMRELLLSLSAIGERT